MLIRIHHLTPDPRQLQKVIDVLRDGGVIIYPTDGVYAFGCDINKSKAVERVAKLKSCLPGPYTFILNANNSVPKLFKNNKRTIGIRIPDNQICRSIVTELGNPIISSSVHDEDELVEYTTDPELIHERYKDQVDLVIDGGYGSLLPSTVIDCTGQMPELVRQGAGEVDLL
jgi:tRNA A37 threonylcarbamoyladenosine synthetase subunit TsaC/SUA5/YrdC